MRCSTIDLGHFTVVLANFIATFRLYSDNLLQATERTVYCIPCQDCDEVYVGETGRTLNIRQKEHKRHLFNGNTEDSAVAAHAHQEVHDIDWENTFVLDYDDNFFKRKVKEALLIRQKNNFNQDSGLAVSPIWLSLL